MAVNKSSTDRNIKRAVGGGNIYDKEDESVTVQIGTSDMHSLSNVG